MLGQLLRADARALPLRDNSVQCVVTSPPYFGLRDYGSTGQIGNEAHPDCLGWATGEPCDRCFTCAMVRVFCQIRYVLKDDGTVWLNLGDSYASSSTYNTTNSLHTAAGWKHDVARRPNAGVPEGFKPKDILGIPWRVALALQAAGWYLRCDHIWHKPSCMPESVKDRCTRNHEYLFLLTKNERYYYDADAIREPLTAYYADTLQQLEGKAVRPQTENFSKERRHTHGVRAASTRAARAGFVNPLGANKRSVWSINPGNFSGAHFATFPEALVKPCILAGSRPGDVVYDPFMGSGTVGAVAARLGRRWVGTELNEEYLQIARERTMQHGLPLTFES